MSRVSARHRVFAVALGSVLTACGSGPPGPAALDTRNERCRFCHMAVSDPSTSGQIVAPAEEPVFFDDIGCLASYLAGHEARRDGAVVYVADHRTKLWVGARSAVYTRVPTLETPMGSHLIAHADAASRAADPVAQGGATVSWEEVFAARERNDE